MAFLGSFTKFFMVPAETVLWLLPRVSGGGAVGAASPQLTAASLMAVLSEGGHKLGKAGHFRP